MNELSFPKLSSKEALSFSIQLNDSEDGELFVWTGWKATVNIVDRDRPTWVKATGSSDGQYVTLPASGVLTAAFPPSIGLCPGQHLVGLILENGNPDDTVQQFIGTLPVIQGV